MSGRHRQGDRAYQHFALIGIDRDGTLRHETSPSIARSREAILSPQVTHEFLRAVARSGEMLPSHSQLESGAQTLPGRTPSRQTPLPQQMGRDPHGMVARGQAHLPVPSITPIMWPAPSVAGPRISEGSIQRKRKPELSLGHPTATISITDKDALRRYYEKIFQNLQQTNCRVIAKAYVRLVEPRKQVSYPYNGRKIVDGKTQQLSPDETKPPWWPSGVSHREPDHLPKAERVKLLVHILCELHDSHGITTRRLKEADHPIRRQISPAERVQLLDELYHVRDQEVKYSKGQPDGKATVSISRANLPDALQLAASQTEPSRRNTPTDDTHSRGSNPEIKALRTGSARDETLPPSALPSEEIPPRLPSNPPLPTHSPTQYIQQDLPIHPSFDHASPSSPQDLKRKRAWVETGTGPPSTTSSMEFYSPMYVDSQSFMPDAFENPQPIPHPDIPVTGAPGTGPFGEHMEDYGFPYFFER